MTLLPSQLNTAPISVTLQNSISVTLQSELRRSKPVPVSVAVGPLPQGGARAEAESSEDEFIPETRAVGARQIRGGACGARAAGI